MLLDDRAALVTGGAGRIGAAIAAAFTREGARVALADCDAERLARAAGNAGSTEIATILADTASAAEVERTVAQAEARIGPLAILVTCAAVYPNVPLLEMAADAWDRVYAVNVRGALLASQAMARRWVERGTPGAIVHLSSGAARSARRGMGAYCGSKAALEMLTEVLALELGPAGIRVNAVAPGLVMDEVVRSDAAGLPAYHTEMLRGTPLGRTGDAAEIAEAVVFLASDRSSWTTGSVLAVTGGSHCGRSHLDFTPASALR